MDHSSDTELKVENPSVYDLEVMENRINKLNYETIDSGSVIWEIKDWSSFPDKINGPAFQCGGHTWRVLLFPKGNNNAGDSFSLYCEVVPPEDADDQWSVCAQFLLAIANTEDPRIQYFQQAHHRFHKGESDWGFSRMMDLKSARMPSGNNLKPYIENNSTIVALYVRVIKDPTGVLWHNFQNYDSKKATGYVGLLNQGATCYMNSLLQSLFFTNYFRKAVYQIPTKDDNPHNSVALAIQRVFLQLQNSDVAVGTNELTKSFGWDSLDSFMQHDVQEFNRVLQDNLEGKMKGTEAEGAIQRLFVGKMKSYITCINVHYESSRVEDYYDIQLNVKGCKDVQDSFEKYIEVEFLDGENKYMAEGHGLQDAKKGVIFDSFPPVLHLQLKRFDYDIMRDAMVKINDRYEFPPSINLENFLSPEADRSEPHDYVLHGVLVHSGDLNGGHYFALLRPHPDGKWFKFDDDRVTPAADNEVFEDNFGGDGAPLNQMTGVRNNMRVMKRFSNAYMLVYVRRSRLHEILGEVTDEDIPAHLNQRLKNESDAQLEATKKRQEQDQQVVFQILDDKSIRLHHGCGLADFSISDGTHLTLACSKTHSLKSLKEHLSQHFSIDHSDYRLWVLSARENRTVRPSSLLSDSESDLSLLQIREKYFGNHPPFAFYLETKSDIIPSIPVFPDISENGDVTLLFIKYFDLKSQSLEYLGKFYARKSTLLDEISRELSKLVGLPPMTELELFEEVKPNMIEEINLGSTLSRAGLVTGDIICFQESQGDRMESSKGALEYFENLNNQIRVFFKSKSSSPRFNQVDPSTDIILDLSKKMNYTQFVELLAHKLNADPLKIRLHAPNGIRSLLTTPVNYDPSLLFEDIVRFNTQSPHDIFMYYEVLDVTLAELESKTSIEINIIGGTIKDVSKLNMLVPKDGTFKDVTLLVREKLPESKRSAPYIRFYEADHGRFIRVIEPSSGIKDIYSYTIYAEIPNENEITEDNSLELIVFHFAKDPVRSHGVPFFFKFVQGESYDSLLKRLGSKLGISEKEMAKIRLAHVTGSVQSDMQVTFFENDEEWSKIILDSESLLGLEHADRTPRPSRFAEKAIKIFN